MALDRLARLERLFDGPIPAPLRRWALSGMPPAPPRLQADPGDTAEARPAPPSADDPPGIAAGRVALGALAEGACAPWPSLKP